MTRATFRNTHEVRSHMALACEMPQTDACSTAIGRQPRSGAEITVDGRPWGLWVVLISLSAYTVFILIYTASVSLIITLISALTALAMSEGFRSDPMGHNIMSNPPTDIASTDKQRVGNQIGDDVQGTSPGSCVTWTCGFWHLEV